MTNYIQRIEDLEIQMRECEDKTQLIALEARFRILKWLYENRAEDVPIDHVSLEGRLNAIAQDSE